MNNYSYHAERRVRNMSRGEAAGRRVIDMTGQVINGVEVIRLSEGERNGAYWLCKCPICGKEFTARGISLRAGHVSSCGCGAPFRRTGRPKVKYTLPKSVEKQRKYGCTLCIEKCAEDAPCKYAEILDKYTNYEAYDKEAKKLFESLGLDE
nr:MAG TPA: Putative acetylornithine deacetylase [Caudoviricetes sp.]